MAEDQVTTWLLKLGNGSESAAQAIWEKYFDRLVRLARKKLEGLPLRAVDEEDVALSAMDSFCRAVAAGRYPQLKDRDDLWRLLVTITSHKAVNQFRRARAAKRGSGHVRGDSVFVVNDPADTPPGIDQLLGTEPTPELAVMMAETCEELLSQLGDETLSKIAQLKLEGYTNGEIANDLGCTERSVERKLARIRKIWNREAV
jgi:DNA-directed RNA polymerase specialized sigma24 family protein